MKIANLSFPRRYWLEIMEKDSGPAEIEGRILPDSTIALKTRNVRKLRLLLRPELVHSTGPLHLRVNDREQPAQELKQSCDLFGQSANSYADPSLAYTDESIVNVVK